MIVVENGFAGITQLLDRPRVGAFPLGGTVAASSAAAGFDAVFAQNSETWQFWRPTALPATWELTFAVASTVSYFGIAGHDLGTAGATVIYETWNGANWDTRVTHSPADNSPIFGLLVPRSIAKARIRITGVTLPHVAVIYFGAVIEFPQRAAYVGRQDMQDLISEEFSTPVSDGGHFVGRYVTRRAQPVRLAVRHLSEAFKASTLDPLIGFLRSRPAFFADRPGPFPKSCAYAYTTGNIVPDREIPNSAAAIAVEFQLAGHVA
jgi:hypothetical protein